MASFNRGNFQVALKTIRSNRARSFMTMLGIIVGVVAAIVVVSIGQGVRDQVQDQIGRLGRDVITIRPGAINNDRGLLGKVSNVNSQPFSTLSNQDVKAVRSVDKIKTVTPLSVVDGDVQADDGQGVFRGVVIGTTENFPGTVQRKVDEGAFFSDDETEEQRAVIGANVATDLFGEAVPLGRSFSFRGQEFVVVGIMQHIDTTPLSIDTDLNNSIYIQYARAQALSDNSAPVYEIMATPEHPDQIESTVASINRALKHVHGGQNNFAVMTQDQSMSVSDTVLGLVSSLILGAAIVSLLIGGVGIMNIMLVSVTERMREIGVRKAVGATNRQILNQFMIEATVLSVLGYIVGVILALGIIVFLRLFTEVQPAYQWQIIVISGIVTLLVGIVFGSVPALKAARKDPIDALRNE